jgi:release factor glutamine methyltransferase
MPNPPPVVDREWTVLRLLQWAGAYLKERGIDGPRSTAEILLAHALRTDRLQLYLNYDQPLEKTELSVFKELLRRRLRREPVAYIVGRKGFWTLEVEVSPAVLIPRPETECLVETALKALRGLPEVRPARVLEVGTGSGAIILALAAEAPCHAYFASDLSPEALRVAHRNAEQTGVGERVCFWAADWFSALKPSGAVFDVIVANPPYVVSAEIDTLQPEIAAYEPRLALDGGADGLRSYRVILSEAHRHLTPGGMLLLEIGCNQRLVLHRLSEQIGRYEGFDCARDYSGRERVVVLRKKMLQETAIVVI